MPRMKPTKDAKKPYDRSESASSPTGDGHDDEDIKPNKNIEPKSSKTKKPKLKIKDEANDTSASPSGSPSKNGGSKWRPEEDWALFQLIHPKVDKPDWKRVAAAVGGGRDAKVCHWHCDGSTGYLGVRNVPSVSTHSLRVTFRDSHSQIPRLLRAYALTFQSCQNRYDTWKRNKLEAAIKSIN